MRTASANAYLYTLQLMFLY